MNRKLVASISAGLIVVWAAGARAETSTSRKPIHWLDWNFQPLEQVPGAQTLLWRNDDGIAVRVRTENLKPEIYTLEWFVFNNPEYCFRPFECDVFSDVFNDEPGQLGDPRVRFSWVVGSADFVGRTERGTFAAGLVEGDGSVALIGPGLLDSHKAEIHLVIHEKGNVIPEAVHLQLSTLLCETESCRYSQISTHRVAP